MKAFSNISALAALSCAVAMSVGCSKANAQAATEAASAPAAEIPVAAFTDDEVIVEAYGAKLTYKDALREMKGMLQAQGVPEEQIPMIIEQAVDQALPNIAEQFVMMNAVKADAIKAGFTCSDAEYADAISNITARLPEGMTMDDMFAEAGVEKEKALGMLKDNILMKNYIDNLTKDAKASEEDALKFYNENQQYFEEPAEVRASHILVKVDDKTNTVAKAEAKAKIDGILAKVKAGEDFAALAKANSDCPSGAQGGDLDFFGQGQMVPEFEAAAFALATNEVSGVVETQFGYHIIKVTDRKEAGKQSFDEVKDQIKGFLGQEAAGKIMSEYFEALEKNLIYKANDKIKLFVKEPAPEEIAVEIDPTAAEAK